MRSREGANPFSLGDPDETVDRIVRFLRTHSERIGARRLVVGMSGGLDSSVTAALCAKALGGNRTLGFCLPEDETRSSRSIDDAEKVARKFGIRFKTLDITGLVQSAASLLRDSKKKANIIPYGNLKARLRATILYYHANINRGLVVGTGDKSEIMLGYFCYDSSTKVLTRTGLKDYTGLSAGDVVFSLNTRNGLVEEVPVNGVYHFPYSGYMIHFKGRHTDLLVTPNHNMLVKNRNGRISFRRANALVDSYHFRLPWCEGWLGSPGIAVPPTVPGETDLSDFFYLTGLYLGDGWAGSTDVIVNTKGHSRMEVVNNRGVDGRFRTFDNEPRPTTYRGSSTVFAIPAEDRARRKLETILDHNSIRFGSYAHVVKVSGRKWAETFQSCGTSASTKHVPPWMLRFPADKLRHLFDGLMDSDGSSDGGAYYTISVKLALDMVELCAKLGLQATIRFRPPRVTQYKEKRIVGGPSYQITLAKGPTSLFPKKFGNAALEFYSGVVWCPDVLPWHNLLVERNGMFAFCGNTKYGDGACDLQPMGDLYKTTIRRLAIHLGLPARVYSRPSSPELWPGQTAEDELGLPYSKLDSILWRLERWMPPKDVSEELGLSLTMVERVRRRWLQSEHKRRPPLAIKLGFRTAGQDLRVPYSL